MQTVAQLGTTVFVWAHPDDESYLGGGLMALLRDAGRRVVCVTATRGEVGDGSTTDRQALGRLRERELSAALAALGVLEHVWLGYADGGCAHVDPARTAARVGEVLRRVRPETVVSFGPDGVTGHPDHRAVGAWTRAAVDAHPRAGRPRLLQPVATEADLDEGRDVDEAFGVFAHGGPRVCSGDELAVRLELSGPALSRKLAALRAHRSQTQALMDFLGAERYASWVAVESFAAPEDASEPVAAAARHAQ